MHLSDMLKAGMCKLSHPENLPTEFYFKFTKEQAGHKHVCKLTAAGWLASAEFCSCQLQQSHTGRGCSKQIVIWAP